MGYQLGGPQGDIAFAVLVEGGQSSSTAVAVTDAFLGRPAAESERAGSVTVGRPGKARVTGVCPAAARQPTARTSAAPSAPTASSRVDRSRGLVEHPDPRRGDAVLEDDAPARRRRPRTAPGTAGRTRPRRRRRRPCGPRAARRPGRGRRGGPPRRRRPAACALGAERGARRRRSPRRRRARRPAPRPGRRSPCARSRAPAVVVVSHRRVTPASVLAAQARGDRPEQRGPAPDWSTQAAACERGGRRHLAAQPRPAPRRPRRRGGGRTAPRAAPGAAACSRSSCSPAWSPARPPPRASAGSAAPAAAKAATSDSCTATCAASSSACALVTFSRASTGGGRSSRVASSASPGREAASRVRRENPGGGGRGRGTSRPSSQPGRRAAGDARPASRPRCGTRAPRVPPASVGRPRCAVPAAAAGR